MQNRVRMSGFCNQVFPLLPQRFIPSYSCGVHCPSSIRIDDAYNAYCFTLAIVSQSMRGTYLRRLYVYIYTYTCIDVDKVQMTLAFFSVHSIFNFNLSALSAIYDDAMLSCIILLRFPAKLIASEQTAAAAP